MSSINPHYTFNYSQPSVYRFSHDSVFLSRFVFEKLRGEVQKDWRILDLCAGCGIVGMDFLFHCRNNGVDVPKYCDFLEVQSEYQPHFEANLRLLNLPDTRVRFLMQNYVDIIDGQYDLILCNPPYFDVKNGKLSPSEFKNRCRFFLDATFEDLIQAIARGLKSDGRAYVLTRFPRPVTVPTLRAEVVGDIRGTPLVCYRRGSGLNTA